MMEPAGLLAVTKATEYRRVIQNTKTARKNYAKGFKGQRKEQIV